VYKKEFNKGDSGILVKGLELRFERKLRFKRLSKKHMQKGYHQPNLSIIPV